MSTAVDMAGGITGMVTRPVEEYHEGKRRQARAEALQKFVEKRQQALRNTPADKVSIRTGRSGTSSRSANKQPSIGGHAAAAGAESIGSLAPRALKGMVVDFPLALTEGLNAIPSHYGDNGRDNGKVTGIGSGFAVAGKTFAWGFVDGLSGLVTEPRAEQGCSACLRTRRLALRRASDLLHIRGRGKRSRRRGGSKATGCCMVRASLMGFGQSLFWTRSITCEEHLCRYCMYDSRATTVDPYG
jgi:hypothetical protein